MITIDITTWYGCIIITRMITRCAMSINNRQIKVPNQIYHGYRSPISVMTELAVLPGHGIRIHTAQYMFAHKVALRGAPQRSITLSYSLSKYQKAHELDTAKI